MPFLYVTPIRTDLVPLERAARGLLTQIRRVQRPCKQLGTEDTVVRAAHQVQDELIEWMSMNRHPARVVKVKKARKAECQKPRKTELAA